MNKQKQYKNFENLTFDSFFNLKRIQNSIIRLPFALKHLKVSKEIPDCFNKDSCDISLKS